MVEDSFQQGRSSKPWVSFRLAEKTGVRVGESDFSLAATLLESFKRYLQASNVDAEGPFDNSLGYAVLTCKLPQRVDVLAFSSIKSDPNQWHVRIIPSMPFFKRLLLKWTASSTKKEEEQWQAISPFIVGFLEQIQAFDVRWLTTAEAESVAASGSTHRTSHL
jgi:hypothetical protein